MKPRENISQIEETRSTFIPSVNHISDKIDRCKGKHKRKTPRWEQLYELKEDQKKKHEIQQEEKEKNENNEIENCPFKPLLSTEHHSVSNNSVERRTKDWDKMKNQKINAMINYKKDKEMEECTFSPIIHDAPSERCLAYKINKNKSPNLTKVLMLIIIVYERLFKKEKRS